MYIQDVIQTSTHKLTHAYYYYCYCNDITHTRTHQHTLHSQTGASEQFEQVLFNVHPMRLTLKIYDTLRWCRAHPRLTTSLTLALPAAALGTAITLKLLIR